MASSEPVLVHFLYYFLRIIGAKKRIIGNEKQEQKNRIIGRKKNNPSIKAY